MSKKIFSNEILINKCVRKDYGAKMEFARGVAEYVYFYPIRFRYKKWYINSFAECNEYLLNEYGSRSDNIELGDFCAAIMKKIKKCNIFSSYNFQYKFKTYFDKMLFNELATLYRKLKNNNELPKNLSVDPDYDFAEHSEYADLIKNIFQILDFEDTVFFKVTYLPLFESNFYRKEMEYLAGLNSLSITEMVNRIADESEQAFKKNRIRLSAKSVSSLFGKMNLNTIYAKYNRMIKKLQNDFKI